jgi:hypothetical protein
VAYVGPELLAGDHLLEGFDCGKPALDQWLIRHARKNQASGGSRTWVVVQPGSRDVVVFYASVTASILRSSTPKSMHRNQPEEMSAVLHARMVVDSRHSGHGLEAALLKHFMLKAFEVA